MNPRKECKSGGHATRCVDESGYCSGCRANIRHRQEIEREAKEARRLEILSVVEDALKEHHGYEASPGRGLLMKTLREYLKDAWKHADKMRGTSSMLGAKSEYSYWNGQCHAITGMEEFLDELDSKNVPSPDETK